jgi:hypothetical protein
MTISRARIEGAVRRLAAEHKRLANALRRESHVREQQSTRSIRRRAPRWRRMSKSFAIGTMRERV